MHDATRRKTIQWAHILLAACLGGFLYSPLSMMPEARAIVLYGVFPVIALTGLVLWQWGRLKRLVVRRRNQASQGGAS
ncbi:MAG: hypothetical protein ACXIVD_06355 [Salinarimonas sp.]